MKLTSVIFDNESDKVHSERLRVDAPEDKGGSLRYYFCSSTGKQKGPSHEIDHGVQLVKKCAILLETMMGDELWGDTDMDELMPIISALS
jgi:hypothetical protein